MLGHDPTLMANVTSMIENDRWSRPNPHLKQNQRDNKGTFKIIDYN